MFNYEGYGTLPGIADIRQSVENVFTWGNWEVNKHYIVPTLLAGTARDAGNTPTTLLRPGLLMGMINASRKAKEYNSGGSDGSEDLMGILLYATTTQQYGADTDKWLGWVLCGGNIKESGIIVPGETNIGLVGASAAAATRTAINATGRFILDDHWWQ